MYSGQSKTAYPWLMVPSERVFFQTIGFEIPKKNTSFSRGVKSWAVSKVELSGFVGFGTEVNEGTRVILSARVNKPRLRRIFGCHRADLTGIYSC